MFLIEKKLFHFIFLTLLICILQLQMKNMEILSWQKKNIEYSEQYLNLIMAYHKLENEERGSSHNKP